MAPCIEGFLKVFDWREANSSRRALRVAELKHPSAIGTHADPVQPLFDPVLVRVNERGMVLMGFELRALANGDLVEYSQGWWIRTASLGSGTGSRGERDIARAPAAIPRRREGNAVGP